MRIVFFGTPAFAVPSLEALRQAGHDVALVVTQPDRPRGRSHSTLLPCPVKSAAVAMGIPVLTPERPREPDFLDAVRATEPDLGVVVAYGHLLRPALLAIPRLGLVNVHASLLPRWRGAAPIHWALKSGDNDTGVSIMRVEEGLDTGGVWHERRTAIEPHDTTGTLFERLALLGAEALVEALPRIATGDAPVPQDDTLATHAPMLDRATARIDWNQPAAMVDRHIRAMDPAPGAWTSVEGRDVKLLAGGIGDWRLAIGAASHQSPITSRPGTIREQSGAVVVACSDAWLPLGDVTPAGGKRTAAPVWFHNAQLGEGAAFS